MARRFALSALMVSLMAASPAFAADPYFDVRTYGAKGDGKTLDTAAINKAIEAAAGAGGGTVLFRAGVYPSFSVHLKSNVTLYLDQGATLLGAGPTLAGMRGPGGGGGRGRGAPGTATAPGTGPASATLPVATASGPAAPAALHPGLIVSPEVLAMPNAYDPAEPNEFEANAGHRDGYNQDFGHSHWHNSLIWGEDLHDVAILGPGTIDGNGLAFNSGAGNQNVGNKALALKNCRNVTLRDFTFFRGGHFCILATATDNLTIDNVKFDTTRDAIDIVSCKNVRVSNCYVNSPRDDGICLKADYATGKPRDCENITISNCLVAGYVMGSMLDGTYDRSSRPGTGRIKFGTESAGGFKNITISNIVFDHCHGLALEAVDGGVIEDVTVSNIAMRDLDNSPIFIRLGSRNRTPLLEKTVTSQIRRVNISNVSASAVDPAFPVNISGIPGHSIEDLRLSNIRIAYKGGGTAEQAARTVPENEAAYPEPSMFGALNASAFFIRHVKNLEMHHIDVTFDAPDARPAFWMNDVIDADFQHMKIQRFDNVPLFSLNNVSTFSAQFVRSMADVKKDKVEQELISK